MSRGLLVLLVLSFSLFTPLSFASQFDDDISDIIQRNIDESLIKDAEELSNVSHENMNKMLDELKKDDTVSKITKPAPFSSEGDERSCKKDSEIFKGKYLYFFSYAMPEGSIKDAIKSAVEINKEDKKVVLVVKGFKDNDMVESIKYVWKIIKEMDIKTDLPIEVNPDLFEEYKIIDVPVMIYDDGKVIKSVKGDRNISFLMDKINEKGDNNKGIWGMLYPVKEESVVNYFRSKLAEVLKRYEEQGKNINLEKLYTLDKYTGMFPNAKEERKRCFDPSIELSKNIYDIKGNLLFEAGTVVNPLDFVNIGKYIVINGNDDKQLEYAMKGDYDLIMITEGNAKKIADKYNKIVYFVNDLIIKRLKIEKVPSVIIQEGRSVCVEEKVI